MAQSPVNRVLRPIYELGMIMTALREAKIICTLAWPSCIANLTFLSSMAVMAVRAPSRELLLLLSHTSVASPAHGGATLLQFVGQFGTDALAGAGLGFMWLNVSGQSILYGTGMGLSTLSSQAFGAKNYAASGCSFSASWSTSPCSACRSRCAGGTRSRS